MVKGSCQCRGVQYEADPPFDYLVSCHCSMCRKMHGAAFATFLKAQAKNFRILRGAELLQRYESSPGGFRVFCRTCGSNLPTPPEPGDTTVFIPAGTLDDDPGIRPSAHVFVGSKAPWWEITDALPRFTELPPPQR